MRALALVPLLAACAPARVPPDVAERACFARATAPRAGLVAAPAIGIGIGSGGYRAAGIGIDLAPRTIRRVDPGAAFNTCMIEKTGAPPRVPLATIRKG